ncbi:hypothetical protein ACIBI4_32250 [Streptomyces sp. NPDC050418]|uniref:hypothetical protein n=1 Tax=Streptomyces sp. NPDC050418 TaxID=3365612 RepID=UPI003799DFB8
MKPFRHATRIALATTALLLSAAAVQPALAAAPPAEPRPADDRQVPAVTVDASVAAVDAQEEFRLRGRAGALPAGTEVTLQQRQKKEWVSLPATVRTKADRTYSMRVKLGIKGPNDLRIVACTANESDAYTMRTTAPVCIASKPVRVLVR